MATDQFLYPADPSPVGRRAATRSRTEDGVLKHWQRVIVEEAQVESFHGIGSTFRIPGSQALAQPLWSIENTTGSAVIVEIKELQVATAQSVANTTMPPWFYLFRTTTMPTGGTQFTKTSVDSRDSASAANVIVRGGASADGTISAITAPFVAPRLFSNFGGQLYTAVGVYQSLPVDVIPSQAVGHPLLLQAGQAYVLHVTAALAADNIAARSFIVSCRWNEFTEF